MNCRRTSSLVVLFVAASVTSTILAQDNWRPHLRSLPETVVAPTTAPNGWPDLQGKWQIRNRIGGPQHSIEFGIDPEASVIHGWNRKAREASIIIDPPDGRIPYTSAALVKREQHLANVYAPTKRSHIDPEVRCHINGPPRSHLQGAEIRYAPPYVVFVSIGRQSAAGGHTRLIPMDGRRWASDKIKMYKGDSRGRWEGDTLVIETRNLNDKTWFDSHGSYHTDRMRVIERITMVDEKTMYYEATMIDSDVFTQPWKLATTWDRVDDSERLWEEACYEGEKDSHHMLAAGIRAAKAGHQGVHRHHEPGGPERTFAPAVTTDR